MNIIKKILLLILMVFVSCSVNIGQLTEKDQAGLPAVYTVSDAGDPKLKRVNRLLYSDSQPFTGRLTEQINGEIIGISEYTNGLLNGKEVTYYENGNIKEERYYQNGSKEGEHTGWWENGTLRFIYHFKNDVFDGNVKQWNSSGMLFSDFNYVNGQEEGLQRAWFPNGEVQANYVAKNNRKYGITGVKNCQTTFSE